MKTSIHLFILSVFSLVLFAHPAVAAESSANVIGGYWSRFADHWEVALQQQNTIGMLIIGVGIVALFIITRGKWQK
jgi:hypothetical protein